MPRGRRPSIAALTRLGARKAREMVILTCRTLHFSRVQSSAIVVIRPDRSAAEFVRQTRQYTLEGVDSIATPALVLDAENDQFLKGQPEKLHSALNSRSHLVTLTDAEGAGEHCHMGAMSRLHQVIFDWLDDTLAAHPE